MPGNWKKGVGWDVVGRASKGTGILGAEEGEKCNVIWGHGEESRLFIRTALSKRISVWTGSIFISPIS